MSDTKQWITTSCDIPTTIANLNFVEKHLTEKYFVDEYIIAMENDPKEHIHFVGFSEKKNWTNFVKSLVDKYKLTTSGHGGQRKYATLSKPIHTIERLKIYVTKQSEGNFDDTIRSNLKEEELEKLFALSFKKKEKQKINEEIHEFLEEHDMYSETNLTYHINSHGEKVCDKYQIILKLKKIIINYLRTRTDMNISRTGVMSYAQYHLRKTDHYTDYDKDDLLFQLIF